MRKLLSLLAIIIFSLSLVACSQPSKPTAQDGFITETPKTDDVIQGEDTPVSKSPFSSTISNKEPKVEPGKSGIYKNEEMGFQIEFPASWNKYFSIQKLRNGCIVIAFFGQSKTSQTFIETEDIVGIPFFFLSTESDFINNVGEGPPQKLLGKGKHGNIYKFTGHDYPYDDLNPDRFKEEVTEAELKKLEKDNVKIKEMLAQVDNVLSSFKALP